MPSDPDADPRHRSREPSPPTLANATFEQIRTEVARRFGMSPAAPLRGNPTLGWLRSASHICVLCRSTHTHECHPHIDQPYAPSPAPVTVWCSSCGSLSVRRRAGVTTYPCTAGSAAAVVRELEQSPPPAPEPSPPAESDGDFVWCLVPGLPPYRRWKSRRDAVSIAARYPGATVRRARRLRASELLPRDAWTKLVRRLQKKALGLAPGGSWADGPKNSNGTMQTHRTRDLVTAVLDLRSVLDLNLEVDIFVFDDPEAFDDPDDTGGER